MDIFKLLESGERENIEFKSKLDSAHLLKDRKERLISQMRFRVERGGGFAIYVLGVYDDGRICGLSQRELENTLKVLEVVSKEAGCRITKRELFEDGGFFSKILVEKKIKSERKEHIIIGTLGHVDHGKSTILGAMITGLRDDGSGKLRLFSDVLPHEIERGLSAELSHLIYGFKRDGTPIHLNNPLDKKESAEVVLKSHRFISFVDNPGHEPWLRTTIRGILGGKIDYALLTISSEDGITPITKEHLGIALGMGFPVICVITKCDKADKERRKEIERELSSLLRKVGRIPYKLSSCDDVSTIALKLQDGYICPIVETSSLSGEGIEILDELFFRLPERSNFEDLKKDFLLYTDKIYKVKGAGTVVTGTVSEGVIKKGQDLLIGPIGDEFKKVRALSIMQHNLLQSKASVGDLIGIAIRGVKHEDVRRGMILTDTNPKSVRRFLAEVLILNHPTRIKEGYEPIVHLHTISESATFEKIYDKEFLCTGDVSKVEMRFKYKSYFVREGDQFLFREEKSKGIGGVLKVLD
ncbi:MAG: GTP-binding protein [Candidatus Methanofastidiosia archaeon]